MLLDWLARKHQRENFATAARVISDAVDVLLAKPETRTADLGGTMGTRAFTTCLNDQITRRLDS